MNVIWNFNGFIQVMSSKNYFYLRNNPKFLRFTFGMNIQSTEFGKLNHSTYFDNEIPLLFYGGEI